MVELVGEKYGNIKLAEEIVERLMGDDYSIEEGKILFALKISSIFVYKHCDLSKDYKTVSSMTVSQVFHEYLKREQFKNFEQLLPIF